MNYFFLQKGFKCKVRTQIKSDISTIIFSNENDSELFELKNILCNNSTTSDKVIISNPSPKNYAKSIEKSTVLEKLYKKFRKSSLCLLEELNNILDCNDFILPFATKIHYLSIENLLGDTYESNIESLKFSKSNAINNSINYFDEMPKENELSKDKSSLNINLATFENKLSTPAIQFVLSSPKSNDWILDLNLELTFSAFDWAIKKLRATLKHINTSTNDEKQKSWTYKPQLHYYKEVEKEFVINKESVNINNIIDFFKHLISNLHIDNVTDKFSTLKIKDTISNDGTRCLHYPDGKLAILYIPKNFLFVYDVNERNEIVAMFSNDTKGIIFQAGIQYMQIYIDQNSCKFLNFKYQIEREMKWPKNVNNKLQNSINIIFNSFVSFHCSGKNNIHVKFQFSEKVKPVIFTIHEWLFKNYVFSKENNNLLSNIPYTSNCAMEMNKKCLKNTKREILKTNESETRYILDLEVYKNIIKETLSNWINFYKKRVRLKDFVINKGRIKSAITDRSKTNNCLFYHRKVNRRFSASTVISNDKTVTKNLTRSHLFNSQRPYTAINETNQIMLSTICPLVIQTELMTRNNECYSNSINVYQCLCNKQNITKLTDIELCEFINSVKSSQIIVIGIISTGSLAFQPNSKGKFIENSLSNLISEIYFEDLKDSSQKPCIIYNRKSYRLFLYDISTSGKYLNSTQSLLLRKHQIIPGMCLMFQHGKLIFADYIFNGYSSTKSDLFKQINLCKQLSQNGFHLPSDFQLSFNNESKQWLEESAYSKIQNFNALQNVT